MGTTDYLARCNIKPRGRKNSNSGKRSRTGLPPYKKNLPCPSAGKIFLTVIDNYGLGEELVVVLVELEELDEPLAGDDLSITVVLLSLFFSPGGLVTVVSFCSHAARKAMLIKIHMYFMLLGIRKGPAKCACNVLSYNQLGTGRTSCGIGGRRARSRGRRGFRCGTARTGCRGRSFGLLLARRE